MSYKRMGKKNLSVCKIRLLFLFTIFILLLPHSAYAETKTFIKEYTYHAGDEDSKNSSKTIALREVKKLLLEELGIYLESQTEVKNSQITKDQIITLTAGIVNTEVIEDTWDGKVYWLKAKISANPQDVIKSIDNLRKDRDKVKELEELRKRSEELLRENERLNKDLKIAKGGNQQEVTKAYKLNIDNLSATEWFERGYKLLKGNNTDAVKAFSKAIELDPQYAEAYFGRGAAYEFLGNYKQAVQNFTKTIELNPQAHVAFARGLAYYKLHNYQQAIQDYNKAIELDPRDAMAYSERGRAHFSLHNYQQVIQDSNKAIELDPQYADAYVNRGNAYGILGNKQQEIQDYNKAIELGPRNATAYRLRGSVYIGLHNYQQAIQDSNKAIELDPQHSMGYFVRGLAYGLLGNYQQYIDNFKIAARLGNEKAQDFLRSRGIVW